VFEWGFDYHQWRVAGALLVLVFGLAIYFGMKRW
jgi:hypothetical protein